MVDMRFLVPSETVAGDWRVSREERGRGGRLTQLVTILDGGVRQPGRGLRGAISQRSGRRRCECWISIPSCETIFFNMRCVARIGKRPMTEALAWREPAEMCRIPFLQGGKNMEREGGIIGDFAKNKLARSTMVKKNWASWNRPPPNLGQNFSIFLMHTVLTAVDDTEHNYATILS